MAKVFFNLDFKNGCKKESENYNKIIHLIEKRDSRYDRFIKPFGPTNLIRQRWSK